WARTTVGGRGRKRDVVAPRPSGAAVFGPAIRPPACERSDAAARGRGPWSLVSQQGRNVGMKRIWRGTALGVALVAVAATVFSTTASGSSSSKAAANHARALAGGLPRAQTFYMSGNQWSPNNDLNPAKNWDYITGLVGFAYETPFRYDPLKGKFIPWLATKG